MSRAACRPRTPQRMPPDKERILPLAPIFLDARMRTRLTHVTVPKESFFNEGRTADRSAHALEKALTRGVPGRAKEWRATDPRRPRESKETSTDRGRPISDCHGRNGCKGQRQSPVKVPTPAFGVAPWVETHGHRFL